MLFYQSFTGLRRYLFHRWKASRGASTPLTYGVTQDRAAGAREIRKRRTMIPRAIRLKRAPNTVDEYLNMRYSEYLVVLFVVFVLRCLPGIIVASLGWLLTSRMANKWAQVIARGLLVALAVAPTVAGHAGLIPTAWVFLAVDPHLWLAADLCDVLPLLIVWSLAIPVIYALTRRSGRRQTQSARPSSAPPN